MNYIAVDWGTAHFRALSVRDGKVAASVEDHCGVGRCERAALPAILRQQLQRLEHGWDPQLPVMLCGMVGSNIGIADAGYLALPLDFSELLTRGQALPGILSNPLTLRPGICDRRVNEICRGEEMQLAGGLTLSDAQVFAVVGNHSKWMRVDRPRQRVASLTTLMTGELYQLALNHSVVGKGLPPQTASPAAFLAGVEVAQDVYRGSTTLISELFRCRGRYVLGVLDPASASSWLSGLLMGHEVLSGHPQTESVCFSGSATLLPLYRQVCEALDLPCTTLEAESALLAGLNAVFAEQV
ncbi:2-keto-3-deoxy-galactonokinase [Izhakiella australiensis]|uniref:2-keto-3-deoxy-galactonokinase n=1 Tax=Izhakiella australiensis TaxID=1926881 RepID=A0A1S8YSC3_9GAMM|nr:2-dehydro-3-deoxygalactonokinase [Izhakiella australiensis]OON42081.1 2-keto-3-deoxy-galactonokinase [Izhakiella australiensis]